MSHRSDHLVHEPPTGRTPITTVIAPIVAAVALATALALLTGCIGPGTPGQGTGIRDAGSNPGRIRLITFNSCTEALHQLRIATKTYVTPWGLDTPRSIDSIQFRRSTARGGIAVPDAADTATGGAGGPGEPAYSRTNTHEPGVDEPDLVKTDGRRIVLVSQGVLQVIDPATRRITGRLALPGAKVTGYARVAAAEGNLLLYGDRALVLLQQPFRLTRLPGGPDAAPPIDEPVGPRLFLIDLVDTPKLLSEYRFDGNLIDARQVGATVRVVLRSAPRLQFPQLAQATEKQRLTANQQAIDQAGIEAWLPRYVELSGGQRHAGQVSCERVSRPENYSGTSLVTILSFDLTSPTLGSGDPVTVLADGETVYSNGTHLYLASDQRWRHRLPVPAEAPVSTPDTTGTAGTASPADGPAGAPRLDRPMEHTRIYQFDISGPARPRYLTATSVPGTLLNQYALSEWDGYLRVATTTGLLGGPGAGSSSAVYVLRADGLAETGRVTGLGNGERIYSVRFIGPTGYVVTFRQTDPLYSIDLRDPNRPVVTGELKINGYSTYLHPLDDGQLLGIGQEATSTGRTQGLQVSLFDVRDPNRPVRLARHHVRWGHSEAEFDPHAFLYWPAERLLVVPLIRYGDLRDQGTLALRLTERGFTEVGSISHRDAQGPEMIRRSLVVDGLLWTVSDHTVKATDLATWRTVGLLRR